MTFISACFLPSFHQYIIKKCVLTALLFDAWKSFYIHCKVYLQNRNEFQKACVQEGCSEAVQQIDVRRNVRAPLQCRTQRLLLLLLLLLSSTCYPHLVFFPFQLFDQPPTLSPNSLLEFHLFSLSFVCS